MNLYIYKPYNLTFDENGTVRAVDFAVLVSDGTDSFEINGHTALPLPSGNFIPYEQLIEKEVIEWIKNLVGGQTEEQADAELTAFKLRKAKPIFNGIPWGN